MSESILCFQVLSRSGSRLGLVVWGFFAFFLGMASDSPSRSRSPILARAIAMELHHLPQGDRLDIQRLHDAVQTASEWRHLAGGLEVVDRLLERLSSTAVTSSEIQNFQTLLTTLKNEARQLKTVAHMKMFDTVDSVNLLTDQLARHRDGTPFVTPDGQMSTELAARAEEIQPFPQFSIKWCFSFFFQSIDEQHLFPVFTLREVRLRKARGISARLASQTFLPKTSRWGLLFFFSSIDWLWKIIKSESR